ncbi:ATP-binding protein [Phycisphaerales bacterium AB-hyl4]|uniref:histidine kinase n=1 Tax=Natronomicrosphaera hydrolytica TaxID=3242702 RepID=A0ABV4U3M0_9BACT
MTNPPPLDQSLQARHRRAMFVAAGVVAALFIVYEIVERFWLQGFDVGTLHLLHRVRGVTVALIAAALVGWLIVRASPSLLVRPPHAAASTQGERPTRQQRERNFARWFIVMRWIAVLVAIVLAYLVVRVLHLLPEQVWWPLVVVIIVTAILNLAYMYLQRLNPLPRFLLPMQAYGDLVILTLLLHLSGGVENPLSPLMLFHVIIAGIVLSRAHCYAVATTGSVLFALLASGEATGVLPHYSLEIFPHYEAEHLPHAAHQPMYVISHVSLHAVILFLAAYFVSTLGERMRQDETQLADLAEQAMAHRKLVEQALETTETGLCVCNRQADPYWTNQRWRTWFQGTSVDTVAKRCGCDDDAPARQALHDGQRRTIEVTLPAGENDAGPRIFQITTAPLSGKDGQPSHVVSLAHDVTEQHELQSRLIRAGKLAAVGELAGQVAHEVNNPIAIISAKARLLIEDDAQQMPTKVREELAKIAELADRVAQIAQGLLSYCRPSPATRQPIDVRQPIRSAIHTIDHRARNLSIVIDDQLPDVMPTVHANAGEIQQVFLNLLLNALDAMPDGGRLTITGERRNGDAADASPPQLVLSVADTGVGIPETIQEQVFEPFYTTKTDGKGTGLGLSICAGLIRSHGGRIHLKSEPGDGAKVFVELPIDADRENRTNA